MKNFKMGAKTYFFLSLFVVVSAVAFYFAYMSATGKISFEFKIGSASANLLVSVLFLLVALSHLTSFVVVLINIFKNKNIALSLDANGIHNTFVFVMFGAAMLVLPVKEIPWEAVKEINEERGVCALRVDPDIIEANFLAKKYLKSQSFMCGQPFVKPTVTEADIREFKSL